MIARMGFIVLAGTALAAHGALTNFTEEFTSSSENWRCSDTVTPLTWVSGGGPDGAGDAYASFTNVSFVGAADASLRVMVRGHDSYNSSGDAFVGGWIASGVAVFSISVRHTLPTSAMFGVRFASAANFPGGVAATPVAIPPGEWTTIVVPIASNNPGFVSFEGSSFTNVFANIGNVQVSVYVPAGYGGNAGPFVIDVDKPRLLLAGGAEDGAGAAAPAYDRWMYPFNGSSPPGNRPLASTWGTFSEGFDQRDAQAYFAFDLTNQAPAGLGPESYEIVSAQFSATVSDGEFAYDGDADAWQTYLADTQAMYQADDDAGRPLEVFGAAFRGGYTGWTFGENGVFSPTGSIGYQGVRSVYPLTFRGGLPADASNNVDPDGTGTNGFDPVVFGVGQAAIAEGVDVPLPTTFTFNLDVAQPQVQAYLQQALHDGLLGLVIATLHPAEFGGDVTYPVWDQKESVVGVPASLQIAYRLRPALVLDQSGDRLVASWPPHGNFIVEAAANLTTAPWVSLTHTLAPSNVTRQTVLPAGNSSWYLRLRHP